MIENLTIARAVELAIQSEKIGQDVYRKLAETFAQDDELGPLFHRLADDEKLHENQFTALQRDLETEQLEELSSRDSDYLRTVARVEIFQGRDDPIALAGSVNGRTDALQIAHEIEKNSLLYYGALKDVLEDNRTLAAIIDMEKDHLTQVMKYLMEPDSKVRGTSDDWT